MLVLQWVRSFRCPVLLLTGALTSQSSLSSPEQERSPDSGPETPPANRFHLNWPGGTSSPRIFTVADSSGLEGSKNVPALAFIEFLFVNARQQLKQREIAFLKVHSPTVQMPRSFLGTQAPAGRWCLKN